MMTAVMIGDNEGIILVLVRWNVRDISLICIQKLDRKTKYCIELYSRFKVENNTDNDEQPSNYVRIYLPILKNNQVGFRFQISNPISIVVYFQD